MSGQNIDEEMARRAVEAVKSDEETIRSASAKCRISLTNVANKMTGRVTLLPSPGSPTVLTVDEETAIRDLVVYGSMHCLGNTSQQLCNDIRKLCHDGRSVPSDPAKRPGQVWFAVRYQRYVAPAFTKPTACRRTIALSWMYSTRDFCDKFNLRRRASGTLIK